MTQTEKQSARLGTIRAWNGFESQELGILAPIFFKGYVNTSQQLYI